MRQSCEFHFQEGFTGETVTLAVNGETRLRFEARTRLQIGLAHIATLVLEPRQTVSIAVPSLALGHDHQVAEGDRWVTINIIGRALVVRSAQERPGYV